jgi:hypothetical protein
MVDSLPLISCQFLPPGGSIGPAFNLIENCENANNLATTEAREKLSVDLESFEFYKFIDASMTKFKNNQILLT